jgi:hypothetical protein
VTHKSIEWNLGFAYADVVERLAKMLDKIGSTYTHEITDSAAVFHASLSHGRLELSARPASMPKSSALLQAVRHRTLLSITFTEVSPEDKKDFMQRLTIAFLRVGG